MDSNALTHAILEWLANGETGVSSETIAYTVLGIPYERGRYPLDPSDLRRCVDLLDRIPEIRRRMNKLREFNPVWNDFIDHWDELETMLKEEMANGRRAPRTYARMTEIIGERR